ncbi:DUF1707 SHOCT-like domain-containing protein [Acrocarpospora catenulata]|uniref:DUF1707 SHOCT-like domain-containing protein n=1 Tax=Acrocarpospora catenulata TaxID=2836182 RepID=UPI001BDB029F|nr:DUF1707 domain-containing protein [Acrocarpospora catenulata]
MDLEARASDQDRETTVRRLQQAYADGRLGSEEMEQRVERALTAVSQGDLATLTTDLPERPGEVVNLTSKAGKIVRTGQWRVPRVLRVESEYGSPRLDLSEAVIDYPEVTLDLDLQFGSAHITLPQGASADTDGVNCEWGSVLSEVPGAPRPGLLHVRVTGKLGYGKVRIRYRRTRKHRWFTR